MSVDIDPPQLGPFTGWQIARVARQYGTPTWIYDASSIRARVAQLRQFDVIRFAQKAASNTHLLRIMRAQGAVVDAVSMGEVERALAAGYRIDGDGEPVVLTADILDRSTLRRVVELGVPVNAGSPQMLEQLGEASPGHKVWMRVNPGFGHGHSRKTNTGGESSKHGIWHEQVAESLAIIGRHRLDLVGLHMHIGSGVDYAHLANVCDAMVRIVEDYGVDVRAISAGGGLSVPYSQDEPELDTRHYFALWDSARNSLEDHLGHPVRLEIEPGRYLVANSGVLVAEVRAVKDMGSNRFVLIDAGFNDLMRPALYGSRHSITAISDIGELISTEMLQTVLGGPLCESGDIFTQSGNGELRHVALPDVCVGDLIVLHDTGAYGATMSSTYNSRPLAPEVLIDDGDVRLIRRRQTIDDLLALEQVDR